jgi:murein L,D-transpeptidase YcbB/YkuD
VLSCRKLNQISLCITVQFLFVLVLSCLGIAQQPQARIQGLVSAGKLDGMRWPSFHDYQSDLQEFYAPSNYSPLWTNGTQPSSQATSLIQLFQNAWQKGLEPEDYDASKWTDRVKALQHPDADSAGFDVALSVCAMRYISDIRVGRRNPQRSKFGWEVDRNKYDLANFLRTRLITAQDVPDVVNSVEPPFAGYRRTEQALARYVEFARVDEGGQLPVPAKPVHSGQPYSGVRRLKRILLLLGDLPPDAAEPADYQLYTGALSEGVKHFQRRHGLDDDGRLGPATIKQLNVPLAKRVRQLQLTLERWRWLPQAFSAPPIVVNIPDFRLRALNEDNTVGLDMRVVVGKAIRTETPVFAREMTFVVLRPYWNVPPGILQRTIIPAIQSDRRYIVKNKFEVTTPDGTVVTSGAISDDMLAQLRAGKVAVRQKPGAMNALGLVKLMFPNEYHVYLHSTPATELFSRSRRDFSAGCIRVEKPAELTAWVLRNNSGWNIERIQQGMQQGKDDVTVSLTRRVPVFIVYGTAIAYENDEVHFYDDIYGHDVKLAQAFANGYTHP